MGARAQQGRMIVVGLRRHNSQIVSRFRRDASPRLIDADW